MLTVGATLLVLLLTTFPAASRTAMTSPSSAEVNVVLLPDPGGAPAGAPGVPGRVEVRVVVYSGSADDPPGKEGVAWLTARTIQGEAAQGGGPIATSLRAAVGKDLIVFSAESSRENLESVVAAIVTLTLKPSFEPAIITAQVTQQKAAIDSALHDPVIVAREAFDSFVFRGHPYGHPVLGLLSSISALSRDDLVAFHAQHWRKGNIVIGLAGNVAEPLGARLKTELAGLADGQPERQPRPIRWLPGPRVLVVQSGTAVALRIGHALNVARAHPDYYALKIAEARLQGAGEGIEHFDAGVEQFDLQDTDPGAAGLPRRQQSFSMTVSPVSDSASTARRCLSLLNDLSRQVPADVSWLEQARRSAVGPEGRAAGAVESGLAGTLNEFLSRTPGFSERFAAGLGTVDADRLKSALPRVLFPGHVAIIAVVPDGNAFMDGMLTGPSIGLTRDDFERIAPDALFR
ncbi:MAG TPA: hypothetical protein VFE84_03200 [Patescibacteria group bacterium]|nr:hypothetical protein [Patescibacteria group bacterium]